MSKYDKVDANNVNGTLFDIDLVISVFSENMKKEYDLNVPFQVDQSLLYVYEEISLNWSELNENASPAAGNLKIFLKHNLI